MERRPSGLEAPYNCQLGGLNMSITTLKAATSRPARDWSAAAPELGPDFAERAAAADEGDLFVSENYAALKASGLIAAGVPAEIGGGRASHGAVGQVVRE